MEAGRKLGPYEILEPLGVGGMGEVYRARDSRLERDVAIKVLPPDFAADKERLARFEREAKLLAQLTHPNIAGIYGIEDADGIRFIAMECVGGATLAEKIEAEGRIETDEALAIARQIAEALEAAHEAGIIHRDLKPANIKITSEGQVKVLDFGLAKAFAADGSAAEISPDLSHSPTMAAATRTGVIMGTAAYMSPEQARGKTLDKRTDIWAFGCVLYEMLTGQRTFEGQTVSDILAAIIRAEPDLAALPPGTPSGTVRLIERCLRKDPRQRLRDAGDARLELEEAQSGGSTALDARGVDRTARPAALRELPAITQVMLVGVVAAIAGVAYLLGIGREPARGAGSDAVHQVRLAAPDGYSFGYGYRASVAISRDGRRIAYTTRGGVEGSFGGQLWVQDLEASGPPLAIVGAAEAEAPFFAPDGYSIAFIADGTTLRRVSLAGDPTPEDVAPATTGPGGTWADDGNIYFFPGYSSPLRRVSPDGTIEEMLGGLLDSTIASGLSYPALLPGGEQILVTRQDDDGYSIVAVSLVTGAATTIIDRGRQGRYVPTGHILYGRDTDLVAVRYDPGEGVLSTPVVVATNVVVNPSESFAEFAVADDGTLIYLEAEPGGRWLHRLRPGQPPERLNAAPVSPGANYDGIDVSPDGARVVMVRNDLQLWTFDLERSQMEARLTRSGASWKPIWSSDGKRVLFNSAPAGRQWGFWEITTTRGATPVVVFESSQNKWPGGQAPDGTLAYTRDDEQGGVDVYLLPPGPDAVPRPFLATADREDSPEFSPDGSWIAFENDNTGQLEIYVTTFPDRALTPRISSDGGTYPAFQADGSAIFYSSGDIVYRVEVLDREAMRFSAPEPFVRGVDGLSWDVMPDGSAVIALERRPEPQLRLILGGAALFDGSRPDGATPDGQ